MRLFKRAHREKSDNPETGTRGVDTHAHAAQPERWYRVGGVDCAPVGGVRVLDAKETGLGEPIALFHAEDGQYYAIDDTCTHEDASLADGWLEGCEVECPVHLAAFCLKTGAALTPPASEPVRTYPVRVTEDEVYVGLPVDSE